MKKILLIIAIALPVGLLAQQVPAATNAGIASPAQVVTLSPNSLVPTIVQKTNAVSAAATKTLNITYPSANTLGNTGIVAVGLGNFAAATWSVAVTDTQGNSWNQDAIINQSTTLAVALFHAQNLIAGANTVTVTVSGASSATAGMAAELYEVSGLVIFDNALDQSSTAASAGSAALGNTLPLNNNANDFIVLATAAGTGAGTITPSYAGSFVRNDSATLTPTGGGVVSFNTASAMNQDMNPVAFTSTLTSAAVVSVAASYYVTQLSFQGFVVADIERIGGNAQLGPTAQPGGAPPTGVLGITGTTVTYTPAQLGVNALAYTSGGTTAASNTIDLRGAKSFTLAFNGGAGITTLNIQVFAEDGTTVLVTLSGATSCAANTVALFNQPEAGNAATVQGTCTIGTSAKFPLRAVAFTWTNTNATPGTVTGRMFVGY